MKLPVGLLILVFAGAASVTAQSFGEARDAFLEGEYEAAISGFRDLVAADPAAADARIALMRALVFTGEYEEAVSVGRDAPGLDQVANALGEALVELGRTDEAAQAFDRAINVRNTWTLTAEANLADLLFDRGEIEQATARFDAFIDIYNGANGRLNAVELSAVARAVHFLGRDDPGLFQDALRAFDESGAADPAWLEPKVRAGDLFLEKYDGTAARAEFEAVLQRNPRHPGALLGMAKVLDFEGSSESRRVLEQLLEVNPNHVEARSILAMQHLTREGHEEALAEAGKALAVNPNSLVALTAVAGAHLLSGNQSEFERTRRQVLALNPRYSGMDAALAELAVQTRRYEDAVERARSAVALDSATWEAWGLLGMNELRLGKIEDGEAHLERAFEGDPYNPWFKNSLDLLDTFERFEIRPTEHFELFLNSEEADLLGTYLQPIAEEAYDSLSRRYGIEPPVPVRAELYPSHADFSVRTLGEAGLGALGVSFGSVLVMDSPTARELGDYNWASVFWHELAHTFHLAMTDHKVPRWFSEGLAVHEQRQARPGWGHQPTFSFIQALVDGRLKKVSELNDGFMRPDFPEQVIFSYYQASLVFQLIEEQWGFDAIRQMLNGYRDGETTESLFEAVLGTSTEDFDTVFDDHLRARFRAPIRGLVTIGEQPGPDAGIPELEDFVRGHPGDLLGRLRLGATLMREDRLDEAEPHFEAALQMFPEYGGSDSPYWFLSLIHRERGELDRAAAALARLNSLSESNYASLMAEAEILEELGRPSESAAALDKAVQIWPYEMEVHERLAELHGEVGNYEGAVRERRAVVALNPVDRAQALYLLAVSQMDAGDRTSARRSVLRALEIAPNFEDALELLLTLRSGSREDSR